MAANATRPAAGDSPPASVSFARSSLVYRFENIEIIAALGCVRRDGGEQSLRQQTFHVLLYLLEHRDRLVTRQELTNAIWQDTAVTDNALVQCIAEIRKALGDDRRQPRFVRTIPRAGYRFVAVATESALPHAASVPGDHIQHPPRFRKLGRPVTVALSIAAIVAGAIAALHWLPVHSDVALRPLPGHKGIAVMYFENQSRRADLDWLREGLADMFISDLARSGRMTVLSRQQLRSLLGRIGHDPNAEIPLTGALEIARRSRADSVVQGSFMALGSSIVVNVQLYDANGQLLAADRIVAGKPEEIIGQIDRVSINLVARIGSANSAAGGKPSLGDAMTSNLEAYRYYSLGVSKAQSFENAEAIALLRKAIQLDPKFAMAWARIGYAYSVTDFLPAEGRPYLETAFHLSERLTEKDRLYTQGWYAISREDYPEAIRTFRLIVNEYPLETEAFDSLGLLLIGEERVDEAITVLRQGLLVDPDNKELYNALGMCLSGANRGAEAIAAHQRYVQLVPREPNAHDSLGMSLERAGLYDEALGEFNTAVSLNPKFEPSIIHLGDVYSDQGRYREAIREYLRYIQVTHSDAAKAVAWGSIAQLCWRKKEMARGEKAARNEMRCQKDAVWNSLLYALNRGDAGSAAAFRQKLFGDFPYPVRGARHEQRSFDYFRGMLALQAGRSSEAISWFQQALKHLPPSSGLDKYDDCLANAYLKSGNADAAVQEYERILRWNPSYPLAEYHLAKAWELKHDPVRARAAWKAFLGIWKDADKDIPEVIEAKSKLSVRQVASRTAPVKSGNPATTRP